jgi:phenylacetate-CoA ligase
MVMTMPEADYQERSKLADLQQDRLNLLLDEVWPRNGFYSRKLAGFERNDVRRLEVLARLPFTTKAELLADQEAHPPYGTNLTYPLHHYCRLHQTSGTTGRPLRWLDTAQSWNNLLGLWDSIFAVVGVTAADRLFFAFTFGPFLGFWTAFEAAARLGCLCLSGGGMSSAARLRMLLDNQATVVLSTPTYALRLAEVAREQGITLGKKAGCAVKALIVAGEPGGSIPATRARIEEAWQARVFDHHGTTETGPLGVECPAQPCGLHLLEGDHLVEVIDPTSGQAVTPGTVGELVVTTLGRLGSPLIRYRTGDLVRVDPRPCPCRRTFFRLEGGVLGRTDDMFHVRGHNVYPAALEGVIRRFTEVAEYRIMVDQTGSLTALRIEVEPARDAPDLVARISQAIRDELLFRAEVEVVPPGTLPRFEMKAQRIRRK